MRVTQSKQITVLGVIVVTVTAPPQAYEGIPLTVSASWDTAAGPFDGVYYWGDGASDLINTTLKSISKTHIYAAAGNYTVKVVVVDRNTGAQGEKTAPIQIATKLSATLQPSPAAGDAPLPVSFSIGISGGYLNYVWSLDPGDGSSPYSGTRSAAGTFTQAHTYTKTGTFTATLTATDALGATAVTRAAARIGLVAPGLPEAAAIIIPLVVGFALLKVR